MIGSIRLFLLAALLGVVVACGDDAVDVGAGGPGDGSVDGRVFLSQSVTGHDLLDGTEVRLTFEDGQLGASAGCNSMGAPYSVDDGVLLTEGEGMSMTEMGCDPPRHEQDQWLAGLLTSSPTLELEVDELTISDGTSTIVLLDREVADPDRPLVGTHWEVDGLISGDAVSTGPVGESVYIDFRNDTTMVAEAPGCTSVEVPVEVTEDGIRFGPVAVDDVFCGDLWSHTLEVLAAGEATHRVEAARLTIDAGDVGISAKAVE